MHCQKGFTLIEMLTVVLIIGIISAIAMPQYRRAMQKAQATEAISMLRVMYDSGERLAAQMGYRNFCALSQAEPEIAVFERMDMFDKETIKRCTYSSTSQQSRELQCPNYIYSLNNSPCSPGRHAFTATKRKNPYINLRINLNSSGNPPTYSCTGNQAGCELFGLTD